MRETRSRRARENVDYREGVEDATSSSDDDFEHSGWRMRERSQASKGCLAGTILAYTLITGGAGAGTSSTARETRGKVQGSGSKGNGFKGDGTADGESDEAVKPGRRRRAGCKSGAHGKPKGATGAGSILRYTQKGVDNTLPRPDQLKREASGRSSDQFEGEVAVTGGGSMEKRPVRSSAQGRKQYGADLQEGPSSETNGNSTDAADSSSEEDEEPDLPVNNGAMQGSKVHPPPRRSSRISKGSTGSDFQSTPPTSNSVPSSLGPTRTQRPHRAAAPAIGRLSEPGSCSTHKKISKILKRACSLKDKATPVPPGVELDDRLDDSEVAGSEDPPSAKNNFFDCRRRQKGGTKDVSKGRGSTRRSTRTLPSGSRGGAPLSKPVARPRRAATIRKLSSSEPQSGNNNSNESAETSDDDSGSELDDVDGCRRNSSSDNNRVTIYSSDDEIGHTVSMDRILDSRNKPGGEAEMLVKFKGLSYRKVEWLPYDVVKTSSERVFGSALLSAFYQHKKSGKLDKDDFINGFHPDWLRSDRIIARRTKGGKTEYLVKWRGLGYAEVTWEAENDLEDGDKEALEKFEKNNRAPMRGPKKRKPFDQLPTFGSGRKLRDYQVSSLKWLIHNWYKHVDCILGDEMGLGKTAQSIAALEHQRQFCNIHGPFLVIAPLTTVTHWQREFETWTDMNAVIYYGRLEEKPVIDKYELWYTDQKKTAKQVPKFNVLIASYDTVYKNSALFQSFGWETVIIDEAHRLKNKDAILRNVVLGIRRQWLLLLTGTPIQNNLNELFSIMNLLNPVKYPDEDKFLELYSGKPPSLEQVNALQDELKPLLLRRMKEDVEKLPEKEEIVIWVELTERQRAYYEALYSGHIGMLLAGNYRADMPQLRNLCMEIRKLCCHPCLCNGLEENMRLRHMEVNGKDMSDLDFLVQSSGKMVLLHKLLPKLKQEGHKVLIFSQFRIMLNVIEDYLFEMDYKFERIDGTVKQIDRQYAIDRFSRGGDDSFIFLLSTRAGGAGITLTAADTVIIYDSDWNPQNDLQAMARCHRIGQDNEVKVYRLVTHNSYEQRLFEVASRKYGLEEAILGTINHPTSDPSRMGGKEIMELLKHGAHALTAEAHAQGAAFAAENIDEILKNRAEKRQIGSRAGNSFSQVTFVGKGADTDENRAYWDSVLPNSVQEHDRKMAAEAAEALLPRAQRRKRGQRYQGRYSYDGRHHKPIQAPGHDADFCPEANVQFGEGEDSEHSSIDDDHQAENGESKKPRQRLQTNNEQGGSTLWKMIELVRLCDACAAWGEGKLMKVVADLQSKYPAFKRRSVKEILDTWTVLRTLIERAAELLQANLNKASPAAGAAATASADPEQHMAQTSIDGQLVACDTSEGQPKEKTANDAKSAAQAACEQRKTAIESLVMDHREALLEDLVLPEPAAAVLRSAAALKKILEFSKCWESSLKEHEAFDRLLPDTCGDTLPSELECILVCAPTTKSCGLPVWWGQRHDIMLLRGAQRHGFNTHKRDREVMQKILADPMLGFTECVRSQPPHNNGGKSLADDVEPLANVGQPLDDNGQPQDGHAQHLADMGINTGTQPEAAAPVAHGVNVNPREALANLSQDNWKKLQISMSARLRRLVRMMVHPNGDPRLKQKRSKESTGPPLYKKAAVTKVKSPHHANMKTTTPTSSQKKKSHMPRRGFGPLTSFLSKKTSPQKGPTTAADLLGPGQIATYWTLSPEEDSDYERRRPPATNRGVERVGMDCCDAQRCLSPLQLVRDAEGCKTDRANGKGDDKDASEPTMLKCHHTKCLPKPKSGKRKMRGSPEVFSLSSGSSDYNWGRCAKSLCTEGLMSPSRRRSPRLARKTAGDSPQKECLRPKPYRRSPGRGECSPVKKMRRSPRQHPETQASLKQPKARGAEDGKENSLVVFEEDEEPPEAKAISGGCSQMIITMHSPSKAALAPLKQQTLDAYKRRRVEARDFY